MWKIHRYYLKEVLANAGLTFAVLFGIVLISTVSKGIQRAQGGDLVDAALITLYWSVDTFPHLCTIAVLFAAVLTFARASQDREITAIRAAGISPRVPMVSALLVGVVASLVASLALHYVIPEAHFRKYRVVTEVARNLVLNMGLNSDQVRIRDDMTLVYDERTQDAEQWFLNCRVYQTGGGSKGNLLGPSPVLLAEKARFLPFDEDSDTLTLKVVGVRDPLSTSGGGGEFLFKVDLRSITERSRRDEGEKDISSDQLLAEVERGLHERPGSARYFVHRRGCFALMPMLLAPLGFCIGVMARDRGRVTALLFGIVPLSLFYVTDVISAKLVREYDMPLLAWLPAIVVGAIGLPYCWKLLRV